MRIVTPYGRSHTEIRRVLRLKPDLKEEHAIPDFARGHDALVIAQWISAIDKIASKPKGEKKPTEEQRDLREKLGQACWRLIGEKGLLRGNLHEGFDAKTLWRSKVHPYKDGDYRPREGKKTPRAQGRWYARFAGDVAPDRLDADAVARRIYEHLYEAEYRLDPALPTKRRGLIAARAESIEGNVLKPRTPPAHGSNEAGWNEEDKKRYAADGDVAAAILKAARERENQQKGLKRVTPDIAGKALFDHYAKLFEGDGGKPLSIAAARAKHPGLFALHMAVKDGYTRLLKGHGKKSVLRILPGDMGALYRLIENHGRNRDIDRLIRLGKIVHYEAGEGGSIVETWPVDVAQSRYWTSDGQAEIKRNEAFVRVWRRVLALMQRTATDWADPEGRQDADILIQSAINAVTGDAFPRDTFDARLGLLFGSRAEFFRPTRPEDPDSRKALLRAMLEGLATLRNSAFHFKGLDGFARALEGLGHANIPGSDSLWKKDVVDRAARLAASLIGVRADRFLKQEEAQKLFGALSGAAPAMLPLPRFNRVVARAENTYKGRLALPESVNRDEMKASEALRCQYVCLKLLYERPFRAWLEGADKATLNGFIEKTVERGTRAAQKINANNKSEAERALVVSKASRLGKLAEGESLADFFFRLSAATATEMRVQRGYDSDAEQAQSQAKHIENLKCELLALAFDAWLKREGYGFLTGLKKKCKPAAAPLWTEDDLGTAPAPQDDAEPWQKHLYALLHLAPVGAVSSLLHQMRKWDLLAGPAPSAHKARAAQVMAALELWLDMHDAKFEGGGKAIPGADALKPLYEREADFDTVFAPVTGGPDDDRRIPVRGLRELLRFGHMKPLMPIFEKHKVTEGEVVEFEQGEETIAGHQTDRETIHGEWVKFKDKKKFPQNKKDTYRQALQHVTAHRHRAARVLLTDHARLHDLTMAVLGRLVDYAGLYERDLYFTTLALIHETGKRPEDAFLPGKINEKENYKDGGLDFIAQGRALEALKKRNLAACGKEILAKLENLFNLAETRGLRNRFAHFNMLRGNARVDLTAEVGEARRLMAYDRKLKNAVAKSVIELLAREGLDLCWAIGDDHKLGEARIATRQAEHLGEKKIKESLHGAAFVAMAATLFGGAACQPEQHCRQKPGKEPCDCRKKQH